MCWRQKGGRCEPGTGEEKSRGVVSHRLWGADSAVISQGTEGSIWEFKQSGLRGSAVWTEIGCQLGMEKRIAEQHVGRGRAAKRKEQELDADPGSTVSALAPNLNASQQGAQRKWQTSPTLSILMAFFLSLLPLIFGLNHEIYC